MPWSSTPATPDNLAYIGRPDSAFRRLNNVGFRYHVNFGAQSSRPASSLCTLRTRRSPDGMATLATGPPATALTGVDFHHLGPNRKFH